jgi:hypothetical protein
MLRMIGRVRTRRQLKNGRVLPFAQNREQNDFAIRKFNRVVVSMRIVCVYLSEADEPSRRLLSSEQLEGPVPVYVCFERQFGARK